MCLCPPIHERGPVMPMTPVSVPYSTVTRSPVTCHGIDVTSPVLRNPPRYLVGVQDLHREAEHTWAQAHASGKIAAGSPKSTKSLELLHSNRSYLSPAELS